MNVNGYVVVEVLTVWIIQSFKVREEAPTTFRFTINHVAKTPPDQCSNNQLTFCGSLLHYIFCLAFTCPQISPPKWSRVTGKKTSLERKRKRYNFHFSLLSLSICLCKAVPVCGVSFLRHVHLTHIHES